jgi:hypothetical protein
VKSSMGRTVCESKRLMLAEMRRMGQSGANAFQVLLSSPRVKTKASLRYLWDRIYLKTKSGPDFGDCDWP